MDASTDFAPRLIAWQASHGRHQLPWQGTRDPYPIWISEIMLQQTQVAAVVPYFQRFMSRFPDVASLAAAPLDEVLAAWSGLGYYARARNLHRAAHQVMERHHGDFPRDSQVLAGLPGIGRSTAAAIAAFAAGERVAILDGNVKRVLARHFAVEGFPGTSAVAARLWSLAESLLPASGIEAYTQALMDLGATLCTRSRPRCEACPVASTCAARARDVVAQFPAPRPVRARPRRAATFWLVHRDAGGQTQVLLERRPPAGLWGGLWVFPAELPAGFAAGHVPDGEPLRLHHGFTHFTLDITVLCCSAQGAASALVSALGEPDGQAWFAARQWPHLGLPAPIRTLLETWKASRDAA